MEVYGPHQDHTDMRYSYVHTNEARWMHDMIMRNINLLYICSKKSAIISLHVLNKLLMILI